MVHTPFGNPNNVGVFILVGKFKDSMVYLGRVGEMFDKLGVTEILMDGAM